MASTDAIPVPRKNTAYRFYFAIRKPSDSTLITTWAGMDSEVSLDGASFADCTNEATEIGTSGCGYIDLTSSEMNADNVLLKVTVTNTGAVPLVFTLYPESAGDYRVADTQKVDVETIKTQTLTAAAGITFGVYVGGTGAAALASEVTADRMGALTDWIDGGRLDLILDTIATDTTTDIPATLSGLATSANLATVAGYLDTEIAAILADTNELQTDWTNGGRLDLILDVIAADTTTDIPALINAGINVTSWNSVSLGTTNPLPNAAASGVGGLITAPTTANVAYADVKRLHGTTWLVPAVAGTPDVNAKLVNNDANAAARLHLFADAIDPTTGQIDAGTFAAGAIDAAALAADAVAEIQSGLATAAELLLVKDRVSYGLTVLIGACSDAGTSAETYVHAIGGETFTVDYTGLDATGNRTTTTLSKV